MPMPPGPPPDPEMPRTLETEGTERNIIGLGLTAGSHRTSLTSTSGEIHIYNEGRIIGLAADIAAPGECQLTLEAPIPQPSSPVISATTSTPSGTTTPEVPSPTVLEHEVAVSGIPTPTSPSPIAQKGTNGTSSISMPVRRQEQTEHNLSVSTDSPVPGDTPRRPESAKGFLSIDTEANISFRY
ncbi:hypothetical protein Dda_5792 [Drechslerella dactyloides]|uniref:Uncharacterized protein n=1 Tax=Drechslerella dactyloides TaxID=74499 RepID=A0AAD6IYS7_DREDA|nr:hypothetical protein Dda_5792 [Drechslerella dactyloides]